MKYFWCDHCRILPFGNHEELMRFGSHHFTIETTGYFPCGKGEGFTMKSLTWCLWSSDSDAEFRIQSKSYWALYMDCTTSLVLRCYSKVSNRRRVGAGCCRIHPKLHKRKKLSYRYTSEGLSCHDRKMLWFAAMWCAFAHTFIPHNIFQVMQQSSKLALTLLPRMFLLCLESFLV